MIRSNNKPTSFDLSFPYANLLEVDTIANLKEGFGMLGMRFSGQPRKTQIAKGYAKYVLEHPKEVLRCLPHDNLMLLNEILKKGKGGYTTIKGVEVFNLLQKMNLVVTWESEEEDTSYLYVIDELHDALAPHIEEAIKNPVDYSGPKNIKTPLDAVLFELAKKCKEITTDITKFITRNPPENLTERQLDYLEDALKKHNAALAKYSGRLSALINSNPNGFASRTSDIKLVLNFVNQTQTLIDETQDMVELSREDSVDEGCKDILPDPSELSDEQVDEILNSAPVQQVLNKIKQSRIEEIDAANKALEEEGPFKDYLPAFTKHPAVFPPNKDSYCATRLVRPRIYEVTLPLKGDIYFIVYFHWLEDKGYTQATCYWGNIFDFTTKSAAEPYPGAGYILLSRPFVKKYPNIACVYGAQDNNKRGEHPYLTTIGWDHQPKEWWLSLRLYDLGFANLFMLGPLDNNDVLDAIDDLRDAALAMMRDIQRSDAKQPKQLLNELFDL